MTIPLVRRTPLQALWAPWALWALCASLALIVIASRWPFRSHALFSWDSANFALALVRIDISAHRPHPPGYLGYVFAARALNSVFHDANTALVAWNIIATALAAVVVTRFAWEAAGGERQGVAAVAAGSVVVTSPLLWFYGEVAEIYPSELLFASLIAYMGWRAARHEDRAMYACLAALALAAVFKVVTAVLMFPVAAFAWTRVSPACRRRSVLIAGATGAVLAAAVLAAQPKLPSVVWQALVSSRWLFRGEIADPLRMLNRNARDTLTAIIVALGVVNIGALAIWSVTDRRLPPLLHPALAFLWLMPCLLMCVLVHIAKPGYLLPIVPLAALVVAGFYARLRRPLAIAMIASQAITNTAHFVFLKPASAQTTGGTSPYKSKPILQRAASDLQALTFPTAFTIEQSDERVRALLDVVHSSCPDGRAIVIVGNEPVDWRRVMWYLPSATAVHAVGHSVDFIGKNTDFSAVPSEGLVLQTSCPLIWIAPESGPGGVTAPDLPLTVVPQLGWMSAPGTIVVTRTSVQPGPASR